MKIKPRLTNRKYSKLRHDPVIALVQEQWKAVKRKLEEIQREYQDMVRELARPVKNN